MYTFVYKICANPSACQLLLCSTKSSHWFDLSAQPTLGAGLPDKTTGNEIFSVSCSKHGAC